MSEGKKNYANNEDYNKPFSTMLRKLIEEKKIATQSEVAEYAKVTRQSISSYQNGTSVPSITVFEKIVEFFNIQKNLNYSTDYWLGLVKEPYKNLESKGIYDKLGLTEKSQKILETINTIGKIEEIKKDNKNKYLTPNNKLLIDTINLLLSELEKSTRTAGILDYINKYINLKINNNYVIVIQDDGNIEVYDKKDKSKDKGDVIIPADSQLEIFASKIQQKLGKMRKEKQEQLNIENNSKNSKK